MAIEKYSGVSWSSVAKLSGVAKADIAKVSGQDTPVEGISTTNLVAHWDASNTNSYPGTGTTVTDLVASVDLTMTNGASYSNSGGIDRFVLDGVNDDIGMSGTPSVLQFQFSDPFSIGAWVYPHFNDSAGFQVFVGNPQNGGNFQGVSLINGAPGSRLTPRLWMRTNSFNQLFGIMNGSLTQNSWQYLVATYAGTKGVSSVKFYVNGSEVTGTTGTNTGSATSIPHTQDFQIGSRATTNGFYDGEVADVHYYDVELASSVVLSNYNATKSKFGL